MLCVPVTSDQVKVQVAVKVPVCRGVKAIGAHVITRGDWQLRGHLDQPAEWPGQRLQSINDLMQLTV